MKANLKWKGLLFGLVMSLTLGMTVEAEALSDTSALGGAEYSQNPAVVTNVNVNGFREPVEGQTVRDNLADIDADASDVKSLKWWNYTDLRYMEETEKFQAGHIYRLEGVLTAKEGITYGAMPDVLLNNDVNLVDPYTVGFSKTEIEFSSIEFSLPVSRINITGYKPPIAGQTAEENLKGTGPDENSCSKIVKLAWWEENRRQYLEPSSYFLPGRRYRLEVVLQPLATTSYIDSLQCYVNGKDSLINPDSLDCENWHVQFSTETVTVEYLDTPVLTGVESKFEGVEITWNSVKNARGYRISRKAEIATTDEIIGYSDKPSYLDTTATNGMVYTYTVSCATAFYGYTLSGYDSAGMTIHFKRPPLPLETPAITKLENAANGVKVTWGAVEDAEMYCVIYKKVGGNWGIGGYTTGTSYTVKNLTSGVNYAFTVQCMTADKKTDTSDFDQTGVSIRYIAAPVLKTVENAAGGVKVTWDLSAGAELYKVMYKEPDGSYKTAGYTAENNYTVTGLTAGVEYTFTVRCIMADKKTYTSSYDSKGLTMVYQPAAVKLATPVITKLENTATGVKAAWDAVEGAEMYRLMYKEPGGSFVTGGYTTGTSYTVKNLTSGVEYFFTVRCVTADKKTNTSDYDRVGTSITYIAAPALQKVENASNGVKLTWDLSAGAELYKVMYKEAGGSYKTAGYTTSNSYTVTGLTAGVEYTFTARCIMADKKTYTSSYDSKGLTLVYQPTATKLATPVITKLENTASGVKVTWGAVEGAEMYRLMYKEPDGTFKTGGYTTSTSYTVKNLTGGVTYAFTVRCMTADKKTNTSDYDRVGTYATYIAPPVLTKVYNTASGVKVTWQASAGAELYKVMYKEEGGSWKTGGYSTSTGYTVKNLTEGTAYAFTVRCMTADKSSYTSGYDKTGLSITYVKP